MGHDASAAFFGILKWLGWLVCAAAVVYFVFTLGSRAHPFAKQTAAAMFGGGLSIVAFALIGQMLAAIAGDLQALRKIAQQPRPQIDRQN